ncbi:MAG TPA: hypothetical protein VLG44_05545 [Chlamydiales bacterium]|nr:hypothetical protein [Chlamydiales bacterium]
MVVSTQRSTLFKKDIPDVLLNIVFGFVDTNDLIESEKVGRAWHATVQKLGYNRLLQEYGVQKSETVTSKRLYLELLLQKVHAQIDMVPLNFRHIISLPFVFAGVDHYFRLELHGDFAGMSEVVQNAIDEMAYSIKHSYALPSFEMSFVEEDSEDRYFIQLKKSVLKRRLDKCDKRFKQLQHREIVLLQALTPPPRRRLSNSKSDDQIYTLRRLQLRIRNIIGTFVKGAPKDRSTASREILRTS